MADGKTCKRCKANITGGFITAGPDKKDFYCQGHFTCMECNKDLQGIQYYELDAKVLCPEDFAKLRGAICAKCDKVIDATTKIVTALEKQWHPTCFVCASCKGDLGSGSFYVRDGAPWCEKCGKQ